MKLLGQLPASRTGSEVTKSPHPLYDITLFSLALSSTIINHQISIDRNSQLSMGVLASEG